MRFRFLLFVFSVFTLRASTPNAWDYLPAPRLDLPAPVLTSASPVGPLRKGPASATQALALPLPLSGTQALTSLPPAGNVADAITPEIQNLAASLQNNPARIFEFVYNAIEYEHYYGSKKGSHLTLLEASGNDMDQAALLVALYRAAGYTASYQSRYEIIPYDNTVAQYANQDPATTYTGVTWLGLAPDPFPGLSVDPAQKPDPAWTDLEFKKSALLLNYFYYNGFRAQYHTTYPGSIVVPRTVVVLTVGSTTLIQDPSAKHLTGKTAPDYVAATGFNVSAKSGLLSAASGTEAPNYVSGLQSSALQTRLTTHTQQFIQYIRTQRPNDSVRDLLGRRENQLRTFGTVQGWSWMAAFTDTAENYTAIPQSVMSTFEIQIDENPVYTIPTPSLQGRRLSVTPTTNDTVQVWLDDTIIHSANAATPVYKIKLNARHPHFAYYTTGVPPLNDRTDGGKKYKKTGTYALIYSFAASNRSLQNRQRVLNGYLDAARLLYPALVAPDGSINLPAFPDPTLKRQITTEILNVMGLNWLYQDYQVSQLSAGINKLNLSLLHRFGRMAQEEGFFVDVGLAFTAQFSRDGITTNQTPFYLTSAFLSSALEHGIVDQHNQSADSAVSTIQLLHLANASTDPNKNRIYRATAANWAAIVPELQGYSTTQKSSLQTKVNAGSTVFLPRSAANSKPGWDWNGSGYVDYRITSDNIAIGMIIGGDFAGGFSVMNGPVNPGPVTANFTSSPNTFDTGGVSNLINRTTPAVNVPAFFGADPVDMATGAMVLNKEDLSLGQSGVRGLSFQRHYSSQRQASDSAKLGYGWTHNYDMKAVLRTAPEAGLGETTPAEAAQMIVAAVMINELVRDTASIKPTVAAALIAKNAVDNLLQNAVSLTFGKDSLQFVKQPGGTYTPPAGSTLSLVKTGDTYVATERFGNTYTFDTLNGGRITRITDYFGKTLNFAYTADGLSTVTDAYARTLTLGYTGGRITSVTDSTGRSVSFGYTNGALTTAIDPESQTSTYRYDSQRRLTELIDPDSRTIVVNRYDSEGRVYEQDSEGDSTKTYKLAFTGLRNTETDPLGGEKIFFYDKRGRPIAVQDALGNRTAMLYDGQDHLIEQRTAKGEVYRQSFDADHRLTATENPAGTRTTYAYDTTHRLTQLSQLSPDPAIESRYTSFTYPAGQTANLPSRITYPASQVSQFTYQADGLLSTLTELSYTGNRTTSYAYTPSGRPLTITRPDGSSESFTYDLRDDVKTHTDPRGNTTGYQYNLRRQPVQIQSADTSTTTFGYDAAANLQTITDASGRTRRLTYSATGKLLTDTLAYGTPEAETTTLVYDKRDWLDYGLDPRQQKTDLNYDTAGRLLALINPLNHSATFAYDPNGRRTLQRTPLGRETLVTYDTLGQEATLTDPAGGKVEYSYTPFGELSTLKNRRGQSFQFAYNRNGQALSLKTPLNHTRTFTWNDLSQLSNSSKATGQGTVLSYDTLGRLNSQIDGTGTLTLAYDLNGNPLTLTQGTAVLTRTWDALNRPQSYTNARNQSIGYQYHANGLLWKLTYPGNRVVTYTYYPTNRLKTVVDWAGRTTTYTWDNAGRLTGITRPNGVNRTNVFDNANRLERIYERDGAGRLLNYFKYGFDADSQITSRYRLPKPRPLILPTHTATYDADNRIATWNGQPVTHDPDGNMTNGPLGVAGLVSYTYDARNRLTSVGTVAAGFTSYGYDAENNRVSMANAAGTTRYLIDPHGGGLPRVLVREKPDTSKTTYVYGLGLLYEVNDTTGDATYYHFDNIGNTTALTGPTGTLTDRMEYTPYGQVAYRTGTNDTPFLYVGQLGVQQDPNGLLYMRARYYSPQLMRFVNADPIGFAGGMNWYAYANGNPVMFSDPSGLDWIDNSANFVVGMGDSLSFGITRAVRDNISFYNGTVDYGSKSYFAGEVVETGIEIGLTLGAAALKKGATKAASELGQAGLNAVRREAREVAEVAARQTNEAGERLFVHHSNPLLGHPGGSQTLFPSLGLDAFRNSKLNLEVLTHAEHVAAHQTLRFQEQLFSSFVMNPILTGVRAARNTGMFLLDSNTGDGRK